MTKTMKTNATDLAKIKLSLQVMSDLEKDATKAPEEESVKNEETASPEEPLIPEQVELAKLVAGLSDKPTEEEIDRITELENLLSRKLFSRLK
jgi:hypothetical protein